MLSVSQGKSKRGECAEGEKLCPREVQDDECQKSGVGELRWPEKNGPCPMQHPLKSRECCVGQPGSTQTPATG